MPGPATTESPGPPRRLTLNRLGKGHHAQIVGLAPELPSAVSQRLRDLGLRPGTVVTTVQRAPLGSPTIYRVGESDLCLRQAEASMVLVTVTP